MAYIVEREPRGWRASHATATTGPVDLGFEPLSTSETVEVDADCRIQAWARLLAKVSEVDPLVCPKCGSEMKVIIVIQKTEEIRRILAHLVKIGRSPPGFDPISLTNSHRYPAAPSLAGTVPRASGPSTPSAFFECETGRLSRLEHRIPRSGNRLDAGTYLVRSEMRHDPAFFPAFRISATIIVSTSLLWRRTVTKVSQCQPNLSSSGNERKNMKFAILPLVHASRGVLPLDAFVRCSETRCRASATKEDKRISKSTLRSTLAGMVALRPRQAR